MFLVGYITSCLKLVSGRMPEVLIGSADNELTKRLMNKKKLAGFL